MSKPVAIPPAPPVVLNFPSKACRVYAIAPDADERDVRTHLEARICQLDAMLLAVYGQGGESFRALNEDSQDGYLWACSYMASEIRALYEALPALRARAES